MTKFPSIPVSIQIRALALSTISAATLFCSAQTQPGILDAARLNALRSITAGGMHAPSVGLQALPVEIPTLDSDGNVSLLITLASDDADTGALEQAGLVIERRIGSSLLAAAPPEAVATIATMPGVKAISLDHTLREHNDIAKEETGVNAVHTGSSSMPAFTGKGVVTGIMDRGIDPNHVNFLSEDGEPRIKQIYFYPGEGDPTVFDTPDDIKSFTSDYTMTTHGTHVLGTMAGSHRHTDSGKDYSGVAPDADIAVSCGVFTETNLVRGLLSIYDYAQAADKPCVINVSLGNSYGPHDGSDPLSAMLNDFAAQDGVTVVMSCGNEGDKPVALTGTFTEERPYLQTSIEATEDALYRYNKLSQGVGSIQVWSEDDTPVKVEFLIIDVNSPDEPLYVHEVTDEESYIGTGFAYMNVLPQKPTDVAEFKSNYSNGYLGGACSVSPTNNRFCAELLAYLTSKTATKQENVITVLRVTGQPGKRAFIYNENTFLAFSSRGYDWLDAPTADGSASSICCGPDIITAGSYSTRNVPESLYPEEIIGGVSSYSSWANLVDGRSVPDIVAPGVVIYSSMNSAMRNRYDYDTDYSALYPVVDTFTDINGKTHYWTLMGGTSMAAPFVSGVTALMLSANPDLTTDDVRRILHQTATPCDSPAAGAGKINALAAVQAAYSSSSLRGAETELPATVTVTPDGNGNFTIHAPGENALDVNVYNTSGVIVAKGYTSGDTMSLPLDHLAKGVYIINIGGQKSAVSTKIVR